MIQKGTSKRLQHIRKGTFQVVEKPRESHINFEIKIKKNIELLTFYAEDYAPRELAQLKTCTGLHIVDKAT